MKRRNLHLVWLIASALAIAAPAFAGLAPGGGALVNGSTDPAVVERHRAAGRLGEPQTAASNRTQQNDEAHFGRRSSGSEGPGRAPIVVRVDGGFDWVSAGVGAAGGLGLVLVAGVSASALRRRHPHPA